MVSETAVSAQGTTTWCHVGGVPGKGPTNAEVMIVGVAPAREEMKTKEVYSGPTGKLLRATLKALDLNFSDCYVTNLLCWWSKEPTDEEIAACFPRLMREIQTVKPKVILALGAKPIEMFTGRKRSGDVRGACVWNEDLGCWIIGTWQPTVVLQQSPALISDIIRDLNKINYIKDKPKDFGRVVSTVIRAPVQAQQILDSKWLRDAEYPALDVECKWDQAAGKWTDVLRCLAISDGDQTYVFAESALKGLRWPTTEVKWVFHNGMFDTRIMLANYGVALPIVEDTMLMSYSLDERGGAGDEVTDIAVGIHGLKKLSREYCGADFYEVDLKKSPDDVVWPYNGKDAAYTSRLARLFRARQDAEGVRESYENLTLPQATLCRDELIHGIWVHKDRLNNLAITWGEEWLRLEEELQEEAKGYGWPEPEFNFNSPQQMKRFLSNYLMLPVSDARKETLAQYEDHPWIRKRQRIKRIDKQLSTYVLGTQTVMGDDGRIRPEPSIHATTSGRLTYHKPPVGTVPTGGQYADPDEDPTPETEAIIKEFSQVRGLYGAPPGHVFIEADFSAAELWTAAYYSEDDVMLADLNSGDFHSNAAEAMFKCKRTDFSEAQWKNMRRESKYVTFGVLYNRGARSLYQPAPGQGGNLGKKYSLPEIEEMVKQWHKRYWKHALWADQQVKEAQRTGEQWNVAGRKRRYNAPGLFGFHFANMAVNFPIQSTAHDHLIMARLELGQMYREGTFPARTLFDGHDAVYCECEGGFTVNGKFAIPTGKAKEAVDIIRATMEKPRWFKQGIPVEIKVGPSWAEGKVVLA